MTEPLRETLNAAVKAAMKSGDKPRVAALRLILAAVKQQEVDSRTTADDAAVTGVLTRMAKQRRESIQQFESAGRQDLVDKEAYELGVIEAFLPEQLDESAIAGAVDAAIAETGATAMRDMGQVMAILKTKLAGRADMGRVSAEVKARLSG